MNSIGLHVSIHLCGGQIKDLAVFGEAKPCEHADPANVDLPPCHAQLGDEPGKNRPCCKDRLIEIHTLDEDFVISESVSPTKPGTLGVLTEFHDGLAPDKYYPVFVDYLYYKPPLLVRDIPIYVQSFLI